ncbi:MAG: ribonuclease III [Planctomycetota bacterium]
MPDDSDPPRTRLLLELAEKIGHEFARIELLAEALVHPSMGNERKDSYERLEFLGDAVLGLIVSDHVFRAHPERPEGELTRFRSDIVSKKPLAEKALALDLPRYVMTGRGMSSAEVLSERILANLVESVLAAVYLDGGIRAARRFVKLHLIQPGAEVPRHETPRDPKTMLLHATQGSGLGQPTYRIESQSGPDHEREFVVVALVADRITGRGTGRSKRAAEHAAAADALVQLRARRSDTAPPACDASTGA